MCRIAFKMKIKNCFFILITNKINGSKYNTSQCKTSGNVHKHVFNLKATINVILFLLLIFFVRFF